MTDVERDRLLADCLEDFHRRRALGEAAAPDQYASKLGESHAEFLEILEAAMAIDQAMEPPRAEDALPRPFGAYTLLRELGRGAMGVVYEALHRDLGRKVALKILRTGFDTDSSALERFRREARACAQVQHPNVVEIYEAGQVDGRPYYAMRLLEGETLSGLVRSGRAPDPRTLCAGIADVADALAALHAAGIVHRDVKPSNVLVQSDGRMILADFGLARTVEALGLTRTGEALGTPLYMSPEQMLGKRAEVDERADVYGLGASLYEGLTGRPPFKTDDASELLRMVLSHRPQAPSELVPTVPVDCESIVLKSLEKRREDRYATAGEMRDDLRAFVAGGVVRGRPVSTVRLRLRRMRRYVPAMAAGLVLAAGGAWLYTHRDATFTVSITPSAELVVDGRSMGTTPLSVALSPGEHEIALRREGFVTRPERIRLRPGEDRGFDHPLPVRDVDDADAVNQLLQDAAVRLGRFDAIARHRGASDAAVSPMWPRGDVRLVDLADYRVEMNPEDAVPSGTLEFRRGDEVLWRSPIDEGMFREALPLPEAVRKAVKVGDVITWGVHPDAGGRRGAASAPVVTTFRVVDQDLSALVRGLDERLRGQSEALKGVVRATLFFERGLPTAAYLEAARAAKADPKCLRALVLAHRSLEEMGVGESMLASDLVLRMDEFPDGPARDRVFRR